MNTSLEFFMQAFLEVLSARSCRISQRFSDSRTVMLSFMHPDNSESARHKTPRSQMSSQSHIPHLPLSYTLLRLYIGKRREKLQILTGLDRQSPGRRAVLLVRVGAVQALRREVKEVGALCILDLQPCSRVPCKVDPNSHRCTRRLGEPEGEIGVNPPWRNPSVDEWRGAFFLVLLNDI